MAIPETPLVIKVPPTWVVPDLLLFAPGGYDDLKFFKFLMRYGNWKEKDFDKMTQEEYLEVYKETVEQIKNKNVPK